MEDTSRQPILANDFTAQWRDTRADALAAVERVGESGWLILGDEVEAFERAFAGWWGMRHAVGVASGMDALEISLRCAGAGPGDRVLTTPLTAFATTLAIMRVGAEPVWSDVDESGLLDLDAAEQVLRADPGIGFLVPVHLYGHPLDPDALSGLARDHELTLIEDCAQSAGAERGGRPTGTSGLAAAVSLYPTKNLGALGDGGVILTDDAEFAARARQFRDYGQTARYEHALPGLNSRLDELHAAVLRSAFLPRLDGWIARRAAIAAAYLEELGGDDGPLRPMVARAGRSANHLFPVEVMDGDAEAVRAALRDAGVPVARHYPRLCPDQPAVAGQGTVAGTLERASRIAARELSLPIHPYLRDEQVQRVIAACRQIVRTSDRGGSADG